MKLTETQKDLIHRARRRDDTVWTSMDTGTGPDGGRVRVGSREYNALRDLVRRGLAVCIEEKTYHITDDGRNIKRRYIRARIVVDVINAVSRGETCG